MQQFRGKFAIFFDRNLLEMLKQFLDKYLGNFCGNSCEIPGKVPGGIPRKIFERISFKIPDGSFGEIPEGNPFGHFKMNNRRNFLKFLDKLLEDFSSKFLGKFLKKKRHMEIFANENPGEFPEGIFRGLVKEFHRTIPEIIPDEFL